MAKNVITSRLSFLYRKQAVAYSCAALISVFALIIFTSNTPQAVYSDQGWQVVALQQFVDGESISLNHLSQPDPANLQLDRTGWISFWPPGLNLVLYPLVSEGVSAGTSLRLLAIGCLLLGAVGWALWFAGFPLARSVGMGMAMLAPWIRNYSNNLFWFSGEVFIFAAAPFALLAIVWFVAHWREGQFGVRLLLESFGGGVLLGTGFLLKYSFAFVIAGCLTFSVFSLIRYGRSDDSSRGRGRILFLYAATFLVGCAAAVLAVICVNIWMGGVASSQPIQAPYADWKTLLFGIGIPSISLMDANGLLRWIFLHPDRTITHGAEIIAALGVFGTLFLIGLLRHSDYSEPRVVAATTLFVVSWAGLVVSWVLAPIYAEVRYLESRLIMPAAFAVWPILMVSIAAMWTNRRRLMLAAFVGFYLLLPAAYSVASVVVKVNRMPGGYMTGDANLYNPHLATDSVVAVRGELVRVFQEHSDVWYLTSAMDPLDLPGRAILEHADFMSLESLKQKSYASSEPIRILALLPRSFEQNGKGDAIRDSFKGATKWTHSTVSGSTYDLWMSIME